MKYFVKYLRPKKLSYIFDWRLSPNPTVESRHETSRHNKNDVSCDSWRAVSCVLCRACFNIADDEEAVVLACITTSCCITNFFQLTKEINSCIETNYCDHNFIHLTIKFSCVIAPVALVVTDVSRLLRSSWRAVSRLLYSMHDTARTIFSYTKMHGLDTESWRVVSQQMEFGLYIELNNVQERIL